MIPSRLSIDMAHARQAYLRRQAVTGASTTDALTGMREWARDLRPFSIRRRQQLRPA